jgi:hypothetical protein
MKAGVTGKPVTVVSRKQEQSDRLGKRQRCRQVEKITGRTRMVGRARGDRLVPERCSLIQQDVKLVRALQWLAGSGAKRQSDGAKE